MPPRRIFRNGLRAALQMYIDVVKTEKQQRKIHLNLKTDIFLTSSEQTIHIQRSSKKRAQSTTRSS